MFKGDGSVSDFPEKSVRFDVTTGGWVSNFQKNSMNGSLQLRLGLVTYNSIFTL